MSKYLGSLFLVVLVAGCSGAGPRSAEPAAATESGPRPVDVLQRDVNDDGIDDTLYVYAVDPDTGKQRTEADTDADGVIDFWAIVNPASEQAEEISYDTRGDGSPDVWERYAALKLVETRRDTNADGSPDEWTLYDERGSVTERRQDSDHDGQPDTWSSFRADGQHLERVAYDTDADGQPDRWVNYNEDGSLASVQRDTDGDGIPDTIAVPSQR